MLHLVDKTTETSQQGYNIINSTAEHQEITLDSKLNLIFVWPGVVRIFLTVQSIITLSQTSVYTEIHVRPMMVRFPMISIHQAAL